MISGSTARQVAEQARGWQRKHGLRNDQIEELLQWIAKATGSKSFRDTMELVSEKYKLLREGDDDQDPSR